MKRVPKSEGKEDIRRIRAYESTKQSSKELSEAASMRPACACTKFSVYFITFNLAFL